MLIFPRKQKGMMMLEVMVSVLIFSLGVIGIVVMQGIATTNSVNSEDRTTAARLADDLVAELWMAKSAAVPSDFSVWTSRVGAALRNGVGTMTPVGSQVTVTITWNPQGRADQNNVTAFQTQTAQYSTRVVVQ